MAAIGGEVTSVVTVHGIIFIFLVMGHEILVVESEILVMLSDS